MKGNDRETEAVLNGFNTMQNQVLRRLVRYYKSEGLLGKIQIEILK